MVFIVMILLYMHYLQFTPSDGNTYCAMGIFLVGEYIIMVGLFGVNTCWTVLDVYILGLGLFWVSFAHGLFMWGLGFCWKYVLYGGTLLTKDTFMRGYIVLVIYIYTKGDICC